MYLLGSYLGTDLVLTGEQEVVQLLGTIFR